jgi:ATP-dependent Lon protease
MNLKKPFRISLLEYSSIPIKFKTVVFQKLKILESMNDDSNEYFKLNNWINGFMKIPFNKFKGIDIKIEDGIDKTNDFLLNCRKKLDDCIYGMNEPKEQIIQLISQWIINPNIIGTSIGIGGPAGTGKTTLVREGISKIMYREFVFIPLGGMTDISFFEGHSYTYEGSTWGKLVQSLMECKSMNPVIYFDELDKVSESSKGNEIINSLIHLTDTSQNSEYTDKYFCDIKLDLSKCLFIFSYNDETKISPILRDRMYLIKVCKYNLEEKKIISKNYLMPKILYDLKFNINDIIINDKDINHIITKYCNNDDGIRNLKRCFETIYKKLNTYRLVKNVNVFKQNINIELPIKLPITLNTQLIDCLLVDLIKPNETYLSFYT